MAWDSELVNIFTYCDGMLSCFTQNRAFYLECRQCFDFSLVLHCYANSRHFVTQIKPKPILFRSHTFSRAMRRQHVFALSFDGFIGLSVAFLIG